MIAMETAESTQNNYSVATFHGTATMSPESDWQNSAWYAAYTCARHEKHVSRQLQDCAIESFLPTCHSVRRWKDRRKEIELPLANDDRIRVPQIPGVVRFVSFSGKPARLENSEIESLRSGVVNGIQAEPHPFLKVGERVRVKHGPLAGTEGILLRKKDRLRLVISLALIMRSIATEVQAADLE